MATEDQGKWLHVLESPDATLADSKVRCEINYGGDVTITTKYAEINYYDKSHTRRIPAGQSVDDVYVHLGESDNNSVPAILFEAQLHRKRLHLAIVDVERSHVKRFGGYLRKASTSGEFVIAVDGGVTESPLQEALGQTA